MHKPFQSHFKNFMCNLHDVENRMSSKFILLEYKLND